MSVSSVLPVSYTHLDVYKRQDLVVVEYEGEISNDYEVKGAYSIFTGTLEENGILNQE